MLSQLDQRVESLFEAYERVTKAEVTHDANQLKQNLSEGYSLDFDRGGHTVRVALIAAYERE